MISESYLTPTKNIKILNYKACQSNHSNNTDHDGSMIIIKNNLIHSQVHEINDLQATSILVPLNKYIIPVVLKWWYGEILPGI